MDSGVLERILVNHEKWLNGKGGERADLSGVDLSEADLSYADLRDADLSGVNLRNAKLHCANLSGAKPERSGFERSDYSRRFLKSSTFKLC